MSSECSHDCSSCSSSSSCSEKQSFLEPLNSASSVRKVIAVVSGKGGVGKSLVTSLMAVMMQRKGYNTAVLDADITGPSIPRVFGVNGKACGDENGIYPIVTKNGISVMSINLLLEDETDPVVWRGPVIAGTVKQFWTDVIWKDVDYMFVDMPPGTGDVPLTVFQSLPVDGIIIVTSPQELVSMVVEKAVKMAELMKIPVIGIVENMSYFVCPDCGKKHYIYGNKNINRLAEKYGIYNVASMQIDPKLAAACDDGKIEDCECHDLDNMASFLEE